MIDIAVVGLGKIGAGRHVPTIRAHPRFRLAGAADPRPAHAHDVVPAFATLDALLAAVPEVQAVAVCTPPPMRFAVARAALLAGKHVLLEKPPTATLAEAMLLRDVAQAAGRVLFTAWHSQHSEAVDVARRMLADEQIVGLDINWTEDVRIYHPGQDWIWRIGGFGVFDPGINVLSIITRILPRLPVIKAAELFVPEDADMPIAANITFALDGGGEGRAVFDWRAAAGEHREFTVTTASGKIFAFSVGGRYLSIDGVPTVETANFEYPLLYDRFADLITAGRSEVDIDPAVLTADALQLGRRVLVERLDV